MVFLGGIMVLFVYVSMLRNEDKLSYNGPSLTFFVRYILLIQLLTLDELILNFSYKEFEFSILRELYKNYTMGRLFILMFYLLLTLFTTIKFTEGFKGTIIKLS